MAPNVQAFLHTSPERNTLIFFLKKKKDLKFGE